MEGNSKPVGTSDMPNPQTFAYDKSYVVTDLFRNDLMTVLRELPYVEASKFITVLDNYKESIPSASLNEFIRALAALPYKYVSGLMHILEKKENFDKYFVEVKKS